MTQIRAHFDGKVLIPVEPVSLPTDRVLDIQIINDNDIETLGKLADWAKTLPVDPNTPDDGAAQHDHYLYGHPKKS